MNNPSISTLVDSLRYKPSQAEKFEYDPSRVLPFIKANICPKCHGLLKVDRQPDSLFVFCDNCHDFDLSLHMDIETKEVLLGYSSLFGQSGIIDQEILNQFERILIRKEYISFK
ncbi:MAG: hypothetical protein ACTSVI_00520 [Promethearchaeota archaeon]